MLLMSRNVTVYGGHDHFQLTDLGRVIGCHIVILARIVLKAIENEGTFLGNGQFVSAIENHSPVVQAAGNEVPMPVLSTVQDRS